MQFEDLPGELWLMILSYLSPVEAFYALDGINNTRVQCILNEMYQLEQRHVSLVDLPLILYDFARLSIIAPYSKTMHALTLSNERTPGQINDVLQHYSLPSDLPHLKFLCLIEPSPEEVTTILNDLPDIESIHIRSKEMHTFDVNSIRTIFYSKPSIITCSMSQFRPEFLAKDSVSALQRLTIHSCDYSTFITILNHFVRLEKLTIENLSMARDVNFSSDNLLNKVIPIKDLSLRVFSISFNYLQKLFPYFGYLRRFSLSIVGDEGFDYVNSDRWQSVIATHWPLLEKFHLYSELWHLSPVDLDELYPQLLLFQDDLFWKTRQLSFLSDFYQDDNALHLIFFSTPYPHSNFSNQWGRPVDRSSIFSQLRSPSCSSRPYRNVRRLLLTIYGDRQMQDELNQPGRYFTRIDALTLRFEQRVSSSLFGSYMEKTIDLACVKHLALNDKGHSMSVLFTLISRLPNVDKLTITNNHRILIKQWFQPRHRSFLALLSQRLLHLNLFHDGVLSYAIVQNLQSHFSRLKSFSACLPHFEDFRDTIPTFMHLIPSLQYLHIGLESDYDKKHFGTQDMYDWFRRHTGREQLRLHIETYTNSIHIWL